MTAPPHGRMQHIPDWNSNVSAAKLVWIVPLVALPCGRDNLILIQAIQITSEFDSVMVYKFLCCNHMDSAPKAVLGAGPLRGTPTQSATTTPPWVMSSQFTALLVEP